MSWIQTYTGKAFYPLDPRPDDVCIEDIAHALANQCRFGGHCRIFYSVAEHSLLLARFFARSRTLFDPTLLARWALLHDATEAYLVDLPRPIKRQLPAYAEAEARVMRAIAERFGLTGFCPEAVKRADTRILATEARVIMAPPPMDWEAEDSGAPLIVTIECLLPVQAERQFLQAFLRLFPEQAG